MAQTFDNDDLYQVHAYFALGFQCANCSAVLEISSASEIPTDAWCRDAARVARTARWYVPPEDAGKRDVFYTLCHVCAAAKGLVTAT